MSETEESAYFMLQKPKEASNGYVHKSLGVNTCASVNPDELQKQRNEQARQYEKKELSAGRKPNCDITRRIEAGEDLYPNYDSSIWLRSCREPVEQPISGTMKGTIPHWIEGSFLVNGPGTLEFGEDVFNHVFDGAAMIQRYHIKDGKATYQCRFVETNTWKKNTAANRIVVNEFGTQAAPDPCQTIFQRVAAVFSKREPPSDNALISIYPIGDGLYTFAETPFMIRVEPTTLKTEERVNLNKSLGIVHHTSHPVVNADGTVVNVGLRKASGGLQYALIEFPAEAPASGEASAAQSGRVCGSVAARWPLHPGYMHSFGSTEKYWVLVEQPLTLSVPAILKAHFTGTTATAVLKWFPKYKTLIHLVSKRTGERTHTFEAEEPFFFFHVINAFDKSSDRSSSEDNLLNGAEAERGDLGEVVLDVCCYEDADVISKMYIDSLKNAQQDPDYGRLCRAHAKRFVMPLSPPHRPSEGPRPLASPILLSEISCDMPRIHPQKVGLPYRYFYGITTDICSESPPQLVKVDNCNRTSKTWGEAGISPSEPIFVPHPDAEHEDDGVVLSAFIWTAHTKRAGLVVLDAKNWTEMARIEFHTPGDVPKSFHGWFATQGVSSHL